MYHDISLIPSISIGKVTLNATAVQWLSILPITFFAINMKKASNGLMLIIAIATCPAFGSISKMQMQFWIHACDLSQEDRDNCKSYSCLYALKQLVKPDTRRAYESLGMGSESDLDGFSRLYDVF